LRSVLIVSPEAPIRLLCRVNLEEAGIRVSEAADGVTGVEKARAENPDLIMLAVMLPGRSGLSIAIELREHVETKEIPIVFVSARTEFCDRVDELGLPDIASLRMPFNPLELASFLTGVVARAARSDSARSDRPEDLWALGAIGRTPDGRPVDVEVEEWRRTRAARSEAGDRPSRQGGPRPSRRSSGAA
jgi:DNA-binding response OmpR family regulator